MKNNIQDVNSKVITGFGWKFAERILAQAVSFGLSILLARLLLPEEYGIVSLVLVFITIANVFVSYGFGESLIQKKDSDELDFSTIFYCSLGVAMVLYLCIFLMAPYIEAFYGYSGLAVIFRVLGLKLPIASISTIQNAYVSKHLQFKRFFYSTFIGTVISGVVGVVMAYSGCGAWALVCQYLLNTAIGAIVLFVTVDWHPKFMFSKQRAKQLVSYGWKLTASELINTGYNQLRNLFIGKLYSSADLAFYNKGNHFPQILITNIDSSINGVIFPAMSQRSDDLIRVKSMTRKVMKFTSFFILPLTAGLAVISNELVLLLLGEKWLPCAIFLQWGCLYYATQPIQTANWQALKAIGRSDICFKYEIIKKCIGVMMLLVSVQFGVVFIAISNAVLGIIMALINMYPNTKYLNYSYREQFLDLIPSICCAAIMGVGVMLVRGIQANSLLLVVKIISGIIFYLIASYVLNKQQLTESVSMIKKVVFKK